MKKKYIIKNLKFIQITKTKWWTKYPAYFEIIKRGKNFSIYEEGFFMGQKSDIQSSKRYCRKIYVKNIEKYLKEI